MIDEDKNSLLRMVNAVKREELQEKKKGGGVTIKEHDQKICTKKVGFKRWGTYAEI